jgi:DNA-binding IclR family transcriptional regulator
MIIMWRTVAPRVAMSTAERRGSYGYARRVTNQSIDRAVALMRAISRRPGQASVSELARSVGLTRSTAARLLTTLEGHGLIERARPTDRYTLGYELARLGRRAEPYAGVAVRAEPLLRELADVSGETATLAVPSPDGDIDFIHQIDGPRLIGGRSWLGRRFALHASSSGKLLLAHPRGEELLEMLPERLPACTPKTITNRDELIRELKLSLKRGYAITRDELEEGLLGLSVPVRDDRDDLFAIISISGPTYRMGREQQASALQSLRDAAERLQAMLFRTDSTPGTP